MIHGHQVVETLGLSKRLLLVYLPTYVIGRYLIRAPFGSEGWIISVNNMEDFIGAQISIGLGFLFSLVLCGM
jgi:hypothetical protein